MSHAIDATGIGKTFHPAASVADLLRGRLRHAPVQALTDVSLQVAPGEVLCLMGPNGAGKSTLLRILAGMLVPTTGSARVLGTDLTAADAAFRGRVAFVVGEERSFHWPLSGRQNLAFFAALHPFTSWPMVFPLGVACALLYRRSGSLLPGMLLHACYNGLLLYLTFR